MDAHQAALNKVLEFVGDRPILEITYTAPWGFREISNRVNLSTEEFLSQLYVEKNEICVIHILLGSGMDLSILIEVVNKAIRLCKRVIVLEHNRDSKDWDWNNSFMVADHFLHNCISYSEFFTLSELCGWESIRTSLIDGDSSNDRNFIVELLGKLPTVDYTNRFSVLDRLHIPIFNESKPPNFVHLYDVYIGSADSQTVFLNNKAILKPKGDYTLYATCGGFLSLNYIHFLRNTGMKEIVLFDINPNSTEFAKTVCKLITTNNSRQEFLTNYLLCEIRGSNIQNTPWVQRVRLYLKNYPLYNEVSKRVFQLILNGNPVHEGLTIYGLRNCADNRTDQPGTLLMTANRDNFSSENSLNIGREGWLESNETYLETKAVLETTPLRFLPLNILKLKPEENDLLLTSNIFLYLNEEDIRDLRKRCPCMIVES